MEKNTKIRLVEVVGIVLPVVSLIVALLTWLTPFNPIGSSPFARDVVSTPEPTHISTFPTSGPQTENEKSPEAIQKDTFKTSAYKLIGVSLLLMIALYLFPFALAADYFGKLIGEDFGLSAALWNYVWHEKVISWYWDRATTPAKIFAIVTIIFIIAVEIMSVTVGKPNDNTLNETNIKNNS